MVEGRGRSSLRLLVSGMLDICLSVQDEPG